MFTMKRKLNRKSIYTSDLVNAFLHLKPHEKADLIVRTPHLYYAVARLVRHIEAADGN